MTLKRSGGASPIRRTGERCCLILMQSTRGRQVGSQVYTQHRILYLPNEEILMLQVAGFREITLRGCHAGKLATPDSKVLAFTALK
jgi:hypothetical protein